MIKIIVKIEVRYVLLQSSVHSNVYFLLENSAVAMKVKVRCDVQTQLCYASVSVMKFPVSWTLLGFFSFSFLVMFSCNVQLKKAQILCGKEQEVGEKMASKMA